MSTEEKIKELERVKSGDALTTSAVTYQDRIPDNSEIIVITAKGIHYNEGEPDYVSAWIQIDNIARLIDIELALKLLREQTNK